MRDSEKLAFVKFQRPETFRENGRHIFAVLNAFAAAGYDVYLSGEVKRRLQSIFGQSTADWPPPAKLALSLPDLSIVDSLPRGTDEGLYIFDDEDSALKKHSWRKRLRIGFDLFSPYRFSKPLIMPYNVHPMHANRVVGESLRTLRATERKVRILFAGDLQGYKRRWIKHPKVKLSRMDVIATLKERLGSELRVAESPEMLSDILESAYTRQLVIVDNDCARVAWDRWLDVIARADFFLCPPGIVMPMCHNIIEAMALGTIPVTSYPEWLLPRLEHLKNCIVFDDEDDLILKARMALEMSEDQIAEMRRSVTGYHDLNLTPQTFVSRVEERADDRLDVLLYSEYNVARYAAKLNERSVLMRGEDAVGNWRWLARAWQHAVAGSR
jgi:hypothetical protein